MHFYLKTCRSRASAAILDSAIGVVLPNKRALIAEIRKLEPEEIILCFHSCG